MINMERYEIYVDYIYGFYGCCETYTIEAKSLADAKKKAKAKFMREYFKKSYIKVSKA